MSRIQQKKHLRTVIFYFCTIVVIVLLWMNKAALGRGIITFLNYLAKSYDSLLG